MRLKPLKAQVVVITGASSGIGLVTARHAARAGASLFLIARDGATLAAVAAQIGRRGGRAAYAVADVGNRNELHAAAERALAEYGRFDTWINAAGVAIYAPLLETPRPEHERLFQTNYWGVVNGCEIAVEHFKRRAGANASALITVGSVVSDLGTPLLGAYAASKHAVKGFIDSLRIELLAEKLPVSVTLLKPAGIGSPLAEHAANHGRHAARIPPPAYPPEAVARVILHAAQHPRRELVIGGIAVLQSWAKIAMPRLVDRVSTWIIPLLSHHNRPAIRANNLEAPFENGAERASRETILPRSLYTDLTLHRTGVAVFVLALGALWLQRSMRQSVRKLSTRSARSRRM